MKKYMDFLLLLLSLVMLSACSTSDNVASENIASENIASENMAAKSSAVLAERILSATEVRQLFSGNTYVALIPSRNLQMTVYVDPDGTMRGMQSGHKFTSKWAVSDKGEICVSYKDKMNCRVVMQQEGVYKKFKVNDKGEKVVLVIYQSFAEGNIHNF